MVMTVMVKASELSNDWRPEAHIRVEGLLLFQYRRLQQIRVAREKYKKQIEKWDEEEREILAQRKDEDHGT